MLDDLQVTFSAKVAEEEPDSANIFIMVPQAEVLSYCVQLPGMSGREEEIQRKSRPYRTLSIPEKQRWQIASVHWVRLDVRIRARERTGTLNESSKSLISANVVR